MRRAVQPTRAAISWRNAQRLMLYGLSTPLPIALIERRFGPLRRVSYIVTAFHEGESAAAYFARVDIESAIPMARRIVALLRQLRRLNLSHGDLKATNLLICDGRVLLTDLDALVQHRSDRTAARAHDRDLQRFMRNWEGRPALHALFARLLDAPDADG
jgi:serine/threonine-protein kinase RIO1